MKKTGIAVLLLSAITAMGAATSAQAAASICADTSGAVTRTWTVASAEGCVSTEAGPLNSDADVQGLGGIFDLTSPLVYMTDDGIGSGGDSSIPLNVSFTTGGFGAKPVAGNWSLAAGFWDNFTKAVLTFHNGGGSTANLDKSAAFDLTPGQYSGTFSFTQSSGPGGGQSTIRLFWVDEGGDEEEVSEPGIMLLLGSSLVGLALRNRRRAA